MVVIKEGKVSGILPQEEVFAVLYPGYPLSMTRAVETLGGAEGIIKVRSSQQTKLELRFRPEDPYSHPAFGELRPCNCFLLKISQRKSCDSRRAEACNRTGGTNLGSQQLLSQPGSVAGGKEIQAQLQEEGQMNLCAEIVAQVSEAYHFDGMADYQHVIAVHADVARQTKRNSVVMEEPLAEGCLMDLDQEDVMMLLPPLFAPKDLPENLVLRPSAILSSKRKQEGVAQNCYEMDIGPGLAIGFNVKVIQIPKKVNWEEFIIEGSEQWKWQVAVSNLFDERPIWPKESLTQHLLDKGLKFSHQMLIRLLLRVAYYFSNGPFLRFWIRKGYDPRQDPDSRIYQRTEFRVPKELRSYCDANPTNESRHRWQDLCAFRVFPFKCQTFLQLFELDDDYIQQEIKKSLKQTSCNGKTGWFSECVLDTLRLRVAVRFLSVYPKTGAEDILKSTMEDFEKSKKTCIYKDVLKPDQEEGQQNNRGLIGNEDKEKPKSLNGDEGDEIELDEDEEEPDAYESLDLAGDDDDIFLRSDSYLDMENNSRTYLQELFGSFPASRVGGDEMHDADISDGEYQIYEQGSDDNYLSDDMDDS